jgi:hypothetical protein
MPPFPSRGGSRAKGGSGNHKACVTMDEDGQLVYDYNHVSREASKAEMLLVQQRINVWSWMKWAQLASVVQRLLD